MHRRNDSHLSRRATSVKAVCTAHSSSTASCWCAGTSCRRRRRRWGPKSWSAPQPLGSPACPRCCAAQWRLRRRRAARRAARSVCPPAPPCWTAAAEGMQGVGVLVPGQQRAAAPAAAVRHGHGEMGPQQGAAVLAGVQQVGGQGTGDAGHMQHRSTASTCKQRRLSHAPLIWALNHPPFPSPAQWRG